MKKKMLTSYVLILPKSTLYRKMEKNVNLCFNFAKKHFVLILHENSLKPIIRKLYTS